MFASLIARWWYGDEEQKEKGVRVEEKQRKEKVVDEDGLTEEEDEDEDTAEVNRRFRAAVAFVPSAVDRLDKQTLLTLYGLYKTGTEGTPNAADRPSFFDQKGRAKFDAWWQAAERCTKREAQREYADRLEAAGVGFDPLAMASTSGGFGMRMSRPMMAGDMSATPDAPSSPDAEEWTLWTGAAKADDVETCRRVLAVNPAIMLKREEDSGLTGMHWAADSGSINVCRYLLSVQPSLITELDIEGNQPLHLAALCGYPDVVQLLLEAGASPTVENLEKESAIDIAATPALKRLLMARADEIDEEEERKNEVKGDEEEEVKVNGDE